MPHWLTQSRTHIPTHTLTDDQLTEMYGLYGPNHNVSLDEFFVRVRTQFDYVAQFRLRRTQQLIGFTGVRASVLRLDSGRRIPSVYSGLSFILPEYRGGAQVVFVLCYHALRMKLRMPWATVIVWSDNISYKPYLLTARHIRRFFPSRFVDTPAEMRELRDLLGQRYYAALYDPNTGTVRKGQRRLKQHVAPIDLRASEDPDVCFYAQHNPGHTQGDGLLTLIPADLRNIFSAFVYGVRRPARGRTRSSHAHDSAAALGTAAHPLS